MRFSSTQLDDRRVIPDVWMVGVHHYKLVGADRHPVTNSHASPTGAARLRRWVRSDLEIELPVIKHFSPDVVINDAADVLQELAVDILRDGSACFGCVNRCANRLRLGCSK